MVDNAQYSGVYSRGSAARDLDWRQEDARSARTSFQVLDGTSSQTEIAPLWRIAIKCLVAVAVVAVICSFARIAILGVTENERIAGQSMEAKIDLARSASNDLMVSLTGVSDTQRIIGLATSTYGMYPCETAETIILLPEASQVAAQGVYAGF